MRAQILLICVAYIVSESALIVYYAPTSTAAQKKWVNESVVAWLVLLPSSLHLWVFSLAVFSWLSVYWASRMQKTKTEIAAIRRYFVGANIAWSIAISAGAMSVAVIDDEATLDAVVWWFSGILVVTVPITAMFVVVASRLLLAHIVWTAKKIGRAVDDKTTALIRKLRICSTVVPLCFMSFAVTTAVWLYHRELYSANEVFFSAVVKVSHLVSLCSIMYMFSKREKKVMKPSATTTTRVGSAATALSEQKVDELETEAAKSLLSVDVEQMEQQSVSADEIEVRL